MKPKEMEYKKIENEYIYDETLYIGKFKGFQFKIASCGRYPQAFICTRSNCDCEHFKNNIKTHNKINGGCYFQINHIDSFGFFWEYNRIDDHVCWFNGHEDGGKRWTTQEIFEDITDVINQMIEHKYK